MPAILAAHPAALNLKRVYVMQPKIWEVLFWPPVSDPKYRKTAIWMGSIASFYYAISWGLIMLIGSIIYIFDNPTSNSIITSIQGLIHFVIAAAIGWGIYKRYKVATITGLCLAVLGLVGNLFTKGPLDRVTITFLVIVFMLVHSTRGILAHHKNS